MVETVLVGCNAPNGIVLNLDKYILVNPANNAVQRMDGSATVTLNGWAHRWGSPDPSVQGRGYVLTHVDKSFWDAWFKLNESSSLIRDRIILPPHRDASGQAREVGASVKRMFAPVDETAVAGVKREPAPVG